MYSVIFEVTTKCRPRDDVKGSRTIPSAANHGHSGCHRTANRDLVAQSSVSSIPGHGCMRPSGHSQFASVRQSRSAQPSGAFPRQAGCVASWTPRYCTHGSARYR